MVQRRLFACAVLLLLTSAVSSSQQQRLSFPQLVARADVIFIGDVLEVRSYPVQGRAGTFIKTRVTFRVVEPLSGTRRGVETFEFLGGEWNGVGMAVSGTPRFAEGGRHVVFAERSPSINPIVGGTQGVFRIVRDASGADRVLAVGEQPGPTTLFGAPRDSDRPRPPTLDEFRARVRQLQGARQR